MAHEATRSREEVLAVVAHDLRTPLNFLKIGTQLVGEDCGTPENRDLVQRMEGAVEQMNRLIEDLLEVAKIEAGGLVLQPRRLDPSTLLNDAVAMLKPLGARHGIYLTIEIEPALPAVLADYERILRVFEPGRECGEVSPEGSEVRLTAARHGDHIRFAVIDRGAAIPQEHLERLFDRFWQADRADRRGAGLGLTIAKAIVTAHGGTIGVSSGPRQGSEFYFELPQA